MIPRSVLYLCCLSLCENYEEADEEWRWNRIEIKTTRLREQVEIKREEDGEGAIMKCIFPKH